MESYAMKCRIIHDYSVLRRTSPLCTIRNFALLQC